MSIQRETLETVLTFLEGNAEKYNLTYQYDSNSLACEISVVFDGRLGEGLAVNSETVADVCKQRRNIYENILHERYTRLSS